MRVGSKFSRHPARSYERTGLKEPHISGGLFFFKMTDMLARFKVGGRHLWGGYWQLFVKFGMEAIWSWGITSLEKWIWLMRLLLYKLASLNLLFALLKKKLFSIRKLCSGLGRWCTLRAIDIEQTDYFIYMNWFEVPRAIPSYEREDDIWLCFTTSKMCK